MKRQSGFTLIELIIVIVILGILAVTAAPRFFDFTSDARQSSVQGAAGAIQGAYQTVYARAAIDGQLGATGTVNGIETVFGYPAASEDGILLAANLSGSEWHSAINGDDDSIAITLLSIVDGAPDYSAVQNSECRVVYTEAVNANEPPTVNVDVSGCSGTISGSAPAP